MNTSIEAACTLAGSFRLVPHTLADNTLKHRSVLLCNTLRTSRYTMTDGPENFGKVHVWTGWT